MLYAFLAKYVGSLIFAYVVVMIAHATAAILIGATCIQAAPNFNRCMESFQILFAGVAAQDYTELGVFIRIYVYIYIYIYIQ